MPLADRLDAAIAAVSPRWAFERQKARIRLDRAKAYYDGATRGRRFSEWHTPDTGPSEELRHSLVWLRRRSRDLVRNNPWAKRACSVIPGDVVGYGISYEIKHPRKRLQDNLRALAKAHLETTAIDADERHDFYGLQKLAMRAIVEAGGSLARFRQRRPSDGLPLQFQVQLMEPDHIDLTREGSTTQSNVVVQGVEFSPRGRPDAYYLYQSHPGESGIGIAPRLDSRRIPATEIAYPFRVDRIGQIHGVPWGASAIVTLKDQNDYEDAQLLRQKIAAAFGPIEVSPDATPDDPRNAPMSEAIEPGMFTRASPGYELVFPQPPTVAGYEEHTRLTLRKIAAAYDVPYEVLTGDLSNVSFSSGRMGRLPYYNSIDEWQWSLLIPQLCQPIARWFLQQAELRFPGAIEAEFIWTPPKKQMIDPTREVPAKAAEIASGLITHSEAIRERGYTPEAFRLEYEQDAEWLKKVGLPPFAKAAEPAQAERPEDEPEAEQPPRPGPRRVA